MPRQSILDDEEPEEAQQRIVYNEFNMQLLISHAEHQQGREAASLAEEDEGEDGSEDEEEQGDGDDDNNLK